MQLANQKRGFTLIEMMVAVALFVVVAFISTAALVAMSAALQRAQNIKTVVETTGIAIDSMALRMVTKSIADFVCTPVCSTGSLVTASTIQFSQGNPAITYKYERIGTRIQLTKTPGGPSFLTPPTVSVNAMTFYVQNASPGGLDRVTMVIDASLVADPTARVTMQSTIISR